MGSDGAVVFALAGLQVRVFDQDPAIARKVLDLAGRAMTDMDAVGLATNIDAALARINLCDSMAELSAMRIMSRNQLSSGSM